MIAYLVLLLALPYTNGYFNFNFKLAHRTFGLEGRFFINSSSLAIKDNVGK